MPGQEREACKKIKYSRLACPDRGERHANISNKTDKHARTGEKGMQKIQIWQISMPGQR